MQYEDDVIINISHICQIAFDYSEEVEANIELDNGRMCCLGGVTLNDILDIEAIEQTEEPKKDVLSLELSDVYIHGDCFSLRVLNVCRDGNIKTLGDLVLKTEPELLRIPNFGRKSVNRIIDVLSKFGLRLKDD